MTEKFKENLAACNYLKRQGIREEDLQAIARSSGYYDVPHFETPTERAYHKLTQYLSQSPVARRISRVMPNFEMSKRILFFHQVREDNPGMECLGRSILFFERLMKTYPEELMTYSSERREIFYTNKPSIDTLLAQQEKDEFFSSRKAS